jgi:Rrf2 family protein
MKISAQEEYGLRCLLQLARVGPTESLSIGQIAEAEGLSSPYVAKLLALLRQGGFVDSVRGRAGGYRLSRPAEQIALGPLLAHLGEPLFEEPGYCERHAGTETGGCCVHLGHSCSLRSLWLTLETWFRATLDHLTVADLLRPGNEVTQLLQERLVELATRVVQSPVPGSAALALRTIPTVASPS